MSWAQVLHKVVALKNGVAAHSGEAEFLSECNVTTFLTEQDIFKDLYMIPSLRLSAEQSNKRPLPRMQSRSRAHDVHKFYVSLKQWRILHAVIDCGGFAEAATHLHLSQSAISYTIAQLQDRLGIQVLKIEGRKARLTDAGRALLDRSRYVLKEAIDLELFARHLGQESCTEVRLVVDQNFPTDILMLALRQYSQGGRGNFVRVTELTMPRAEEVLNEQMMDLAISHIVPVGFLGEPLIEVEYIAVAHPEHPLMKLGRDATITDLERQVQIGVGQCDTFGSKDAQAVRSLRRWSLKSFETVVEATSECHGYAWLPRHRIQKYMDRGSLAPLPLRDKRSFKEMLYLIHGHPASANPNASQLAEIIRGLAQTSSLARK